MPKTVKLTLAFIGIIVSLIGFSLGQTAFAAAATCNDGKPIPADTQQFSYKDYCAGNGGWTNPCIINGGFGLEPDQCPSGGHADPCSTNNTCPGHDPAASTGSASCGQGSNCITTPTSKNQCVGVDKGSESQACNIFGYINDAIKLLSAAIGIVVTIMIITGGIMYSSAGGDPNKVQKAKSLIFKGVFALVGYGLLFAIMQFVLPGGVL